MAHGDDGLDPGLARIGDRLTERNGFGADRHPAEIRIKTDAGENLARARPHRRTDLLPVVTIAAPDRVGGGFDQFHVEAAQRSNAFVLHFESSFRPSRISCAVSAPSPAPRDAAAMAAAACG